MNKAIIEGSICQLKAEALSDTETVTVEYVSEGSFTEPSGKTVHSGLPPFYRVVLHSSPAEGSFIRTEVWLPEDWNGIFVGLGNGGIAGSISYGALALRLRQGYSAANTDMGTSRGYYLSGVDNREVWKDFGWRATHIMTLLGKQLCRVLYGKSPEFSYFFGASTGGQQAMSEAQRFPEDYDGIIAAVPAHNRTNLHAYFLWNHVHLRTREGRVLFTADELNIISDLAAAFFQSRGDGKKGDNFVSSPWQDENTVSDFIAFLAVNHRDFTSEQLDALRAVYSGPVNTVTGKRIYNGMPIGSEIYGCGILDCAAEKAPHFYPFMWTFGADYCAHDFDFGMDMQRVNDLLDEDLNANATDLSAFADRGGRLIMYSGSADPCVPYPDALAYYKEIEMEAERCGKSQEFMKYFLVPGMDHGAGGRGANRVLGSRGEDLMAALRAWREEGTPPEFLIAERRERQEDGSTALRFSRKISPCDISTANAPTYWN